MEISSITASVRHINKRSSESNSRGKRYLYLKEVHTLNKGLCFWVECYQPSCSSVPESNNGDGTHIKIWKIYQVKIEESWRRFYEDVEISKNTAELKMTKTVPSFLQNDDGTWAQSSEVSNRLLLDEEEGTFLFQY